MLAANLTSGITDQDFGTVSNDYIATGAVWLHLSRLVRSFPDQGTIYHIG